MDTPSPRVDSSDTAGPKHSWFRVPDTGWLAVIGASIFVSGFILLAASGQPLPIAALTLVAGGAVVVAPPLLALCIAVAASESFGGRAWASGFRRLDAGERTRRSTALRGIRYAGVLWLANGAALWYAALVAAW